MKSGSLLMDLNSVVFTIPHSAALSVLARTVRVHHCVTSFIQVLEDSQETKTQEGRKVNLFSAAYIQTKEKRRWKKR